MIDQCLALGACTPPQIAQPGPPNPNPIVTPHTPIVTPYTPIVTTYIPTLTLPDPPPPPPPHPDLAAPSALPEPPPAPKGGSGQWVVGGGLSSKPKESHPPCVSASLLVAEPFFRP